jgi:hypothetical protein
MEKTGKEILDHLETGIRQALKEELSYSKENGFANDHYWLHRKLNQIVDEMRDYYELDAWTPYFSCDEDYVRGMCQAFNEVIDLVPEHEKEIKRHIRQSQESGFIDLMDKRRKNEWATYEPWPMHGGDAK